MICLFPEAIRVWFRPVRTSGLSQTDIGIYPQSCELLQSPRSMLKTHPSVIPRDVKCSKMFSIHSFHISAGFTINLVHGIFLRKIIFCPKNGTGFLLCRLSNTPISFVLNLQLQISQAGTVHPGSPGWTAPTLPDRPEPESGCWSRKPSA